MVVVDVLLRLWVVVDGGAESKRRSRGCTELEGSEHSGKALERIAFLASINYGVIQIRVRKSQQLEARTKQCAVMFFSYLHYMISRLLNCAHIHVGQGNKRFRHRCQNS